MTGHVLQEGNLDAIPVVDLVLGALRAPGAAGLELSRGNVRRRFSFADGALLRVDSPTADESLLKMLLKRKKIDESAAGVLREGAQGENTHIFEALAESGLVEGDDLVKECSLWATLVLIQTVGWTEGAYRIETIEQPQQPAGITLNVGVPAAMVRGVYKRMDLADINAILAPYATALAVPPETLPFAADSLDLDPQQLEFWNSIDGKRSVEEMLEFGHLDAEGTARMLFVLHRLGMLSFEDPDIVDAERGPSSEARVLDVEDSDDQSQPIDMSAIRFRREGRARPDSDTFHSVTPGSKESLNSVGDGPIRVEVGVGHSGAQDEPVAQTSTQDLSGLFDGIGLPTPPSTPSPAVTFGAEEIDRPTTDAPPETGGDLPPTGAGPIIDTEEWLRLTTKDKERIRGLRTELNRMEESDFFEFFNLTHESPPNAVKKAYFQMAKLYHPDSLLDEPAPYRMLAEALFARFSEAWETLSDEEARDLYTRKHIFGEKDENDLAMEQVQKVLDAEASFKNGLRLLNAGKLQDALRHLKTAHENYNEEAEYLAYYAFVLFRTRRGDQEAAQESLEMMKQAIQMSPNSAKVYHLTGKIHLLRNDSDQAKKFLRKTLKLQADNTEALRDYRRADALTAEGKGGSSSKGGKGGFFSRFGRKKQEAPKEKSEEEKFLDSLDLDF